MISDLTVADELFLADLHPDVRALVERVAQARAQLVRDRYETNLTCDRCHLTRSVQQVLDAGSECIRCARDLEGLIPKELA